MKFNNNQVVYVDLLGCGVLCVGCIVGVTFTTHSGEYVYTVLTGFGRFEVQEGRIHLTS